MAYELKKAKIAIRCDATGAMISLRQVGLSVYRLYGWRRFLMFGYWRALLAKHVNAGGSTK